MILFLFFNFSETHHNLDIFQIEYMDSPLGTMTLDESCFSKHWCWLFLQWNLRLGQVFQAFLKALYFQFAQYCSLPSSSTRAFLICPSSRFSRYSCPEILKYVLLNPLPHISTLTCLIEEQGLISEQGGIFLQFNKQAGWNKRAGRNTSVIFWWILGFLAKYY